MKTLINIWYSLTKSPCAQFPPLVRLFCASNPLHIPAGGLRNSRHWQTSPLLEPHLQFLLQVIYWPSLVQIQCWPSAERALQWPDYPPLRACVTANSAHSVGDRCWSISKCCSRFHVFKQQLSLSSLRWTDFNVHIPNSLLNSIPLFLLIVCNCLW